MALTQRLRIFVPHASERFTDHHAHGDGLVAFEVASRLAKRGHEVYVMSPQIDVRGTLPPTLHLEGSKAPQHGLGRIAYLPGVRAAYARARRGGPIDIIHQLNPVYAGMSLALADANVPVVLGTYVGLWPKEADSPNLMGGTTMPFAEPLRRAVMRVQQRCAAALIVSTPAAHALIVEPERSRSKTFTIPHGIDPSRYGDGNDATGSEGPPTILFLGGTERRKGIYDLLQAFAIVNAAMPHVHLAIAGAGGREDAVAAVVREMPERGNVDLLGQIERARVPEVMRRATVFAAPSIGEPFGMSLLEAMASGKPVVVTDAGGPKYIVDDAGGRKVPVGDVSALARALLDILSSPDRARAMGRFNRARVEEYYSWDRVIASTEDVYAHVLAERRPS